MNDYSQDFTVKTLRPNSAKNLTLNKKYKVIGFADIVQHSILSTGEKAAHLEADYRIAVEAENPNRLIVLPPNKIVTNKVTGEKMNIKTGGGDYGDDYSLTGEGYTYQRAVSLVILKEWRKKFGEVTKPAQEENKGCTPQPSAEDLQRLEALVKRYVNEFYPKDKPEDIEEINTPPAEKKSSKKGKKVEKKVEEKKEEVTNPLDGIDDL